MKGSRGINMGMEQRWKIITVAMQWHLSGNAAGSEWHWRANEVALERYRSGIGVALD